MSRLLFHECLGRGGYGEVYRATWHRREMELEVAVKVLNASVAKGSEAQKRLKDEARLLGALTHPGILRVYDLVELRGNVAMIAEYVDGADLDRCVLEGLPAKALLETVSRVSSALAAAWGDISPVSGKPLRLVHRDVKPENVRITPHGEVKLLDFGVARAAELRRESETATNTVLGSYRYMAPERFDTGLEPHPSVDVFALGCILYEGLAFRRLFEHLSMREMLVLSLPGTERYEAYIEERLAELPDTTDPTTVQLIKRLVSRDPAHRPMPGRLAALCDDEADRVEGQGLSQWCRARQWVRLANTAGEWTGLSYDITDSQSSEHDIGMVYTEVPNEAHASEATESSMEFDARELLEEPGFAPRDLGFGDDVMPADAQTEPDVFADFGSAEMEDEPTVGTIRPPPPPAPPIASSTRDPAPPRTAGPPRRSLSEPVELPLPQPHPPGRPNPNAVDPDETLQQPRSVLDEVEAELAAERAAKAAPPVDDEPVTEGPPATDGPAVEAPGAEAAEAELEPVAAETIDLSSDEEGDTTEPDSVLPPIEPPESEAEVPPDAEPERDPADLPTARTSTDEKVEADVTIDPDPSPEIEVNPLPKRPRYDEDATLPAPPPDAPTRPRSEDPDRTATETVDIAKLRAKIQAEKERFEKLRASRRLEEDAPTADRPAPDPDTQDRIPDDLFDVPIADAPEEDSIPPGSPTQPPQRVRAAEAKAPPARKKGRAGGSLTAPVIGNLAALGLLGAVLFLCVVLGLWIVFS
ncbi:MAG: protein kinase [Alphaproteobacteria bacterium]|nr:protein kinase [Alphaproteobacteria bacterium]